MRKVKYNANNQFQIERFKFQKGINEIPDEKLDKMLLYSAFQNRVEAGIIEIPAVSLIILEEKQEDTFSVDEKLGNQKDKKKPLKSRKNKKKDKE